MATANLTNVVKDPSGTAVVGAAITAELLPCPGFRADDSEIAPVESTTTDGTGAYSLTLERNDQITPANTYYRIKEDLGSTHGTKTYLVQVTGNASLLNSLVSVANPPPAPTLLLPSMYGVTVTNVLLGGSGVVGVAATLSRSDHVHALRLPSFLRTGISATIATGGFVDLDCDNNGVAEANYGGFTLANADLTVPEAGIYVVSATGEWAGNTTGTRGMRIDVAGVNIGSNQELASNNSSVYNAFGSALMTAGASFKFRVQQSSGGNLGISGVRIFASLIARTYT